ncbi:MAG: D-alanine--D-alanine ligase [Nitrospiraceae bacterium]|nr:MAG: D-alanine--D-alanine ligase [Nitrospiraceae bacterium]
MKLLTAKRVAVLMGGQSAEHEISIRSGLAVWTALIQKGYDAIPLEVDSSVVARLREVRGQIAFIALHGPGGEDGTIQGMLEVLRIPYTGSGVQACALAMDKALTKILLEQSGMPVPRGFVLEQCDCRKPLPGGFKLPLVVKPVSQGSTLGITIVRKSRNLRKALDAAFAYGPAALIEEYIDGREFTVGILSDKSLPVVEIIPRGGFYDFAAKYTPGATVYKAPAPLPGRAAKLLQTLALQAHHRLGCKGATRVDFRLDRKGRPFLLEINTVPGMTETSLLPMAAKAARLSYEDMVEAILQSAIEREISWTPSRSRG